MQSSVRPPGTLRFHPCVSQRLLGIHLHVSRLPFLQWSIPDAWNDTRSANCGIIKLILHGRVCVWTELNWTSRHNSLSSAAWHMHGDHLPEMFWICDTLRLAHDQLPPLLSIRQNSNAHQMLISLCPKVQSDSAGWLHYACQSQSELVPVDWAPA